MPSDRHGRGPFVPLLGRAELERGGSTARAAPAAWAPAPPASCRRCRRARGRRTRRGRSPTGRATPARRRRARGRCRAGRRRRASVAALVVAQHPVAGGQRRRLRVPHVQRRPQRIGEHDDRCAVGTLEAVVDLDAHSSSSARSMNTPTEPVVSPSITPVMFASIRSVSTVRPASASCSDHAAPPVPASASDSASPLAVPSARRALVLARHRLQQHAGRRPHRARRRPRADRADRVLLVWHRRGAAAAAGAVLGDLADLGLRQQRDVERDLARARPRARPARRPARRPAGGAVPGQRGLPPARARGEPVEHRRTAVAERGQGPGRAAELRGQRRGSSRSRAGRRATPASQPAALSPKVIGTRLLRRGCGPPSGCRGGRAASRAQAPIDARRGRPSTGPSARRATSTRRVSRMSWLVAPR